MNLEEFLDHYNIEYTIQGDRVVTKKSCINLSGYSIKELPNDIGRLVCRSLNLSYNLITCLPDSIFKMKVCELHLDYNKITEIPESIGEFVGDWFNISYNQITTFPISIDDSKVRTICFLGADLAIPTRQTFNEVEITDEYIYCDRILTWYKSKKKLNQYTIYIGYHGNYVVQDGDVFAHGYSIKQCINDIVYKESDRDKSKYKCLDQDEKLPLEEVIVMYRAITGACSGGVKRFLNNVDLPKELSINDVKKITIGKYGNEDFVEFFNKNSDVKNEEKKEKVMNFLKFKKLAI